LLLISERTYRALEGFGLAEYEIKAYTTLGNMVSRPQLNLAGTLLYLTQRSMRFLTVWKRKVDRC